MNVVILFSILITTEIFSCTKHNIEKRDRFDFLEFFKPVQEPVSDIYDFIVVGSGSAGSVIANRLSEIAEWNILLLEVGEEENRFAQIPLVNPALQFTKYNWRYFMEYQPGVALGCEDYRMPWPRGRALGGTTVINYMIYTRGQRYDYDRLAEEGNPGWSYKDVLPYFIKSENAGLKYNVDYDYHGVNGYLNVEDAYQSEITSAFIEGLNELGLPTIDYNANRTLGVSTLQATTTKGRKLSVAQAFLRPVSRRPNLHVIMRALVTRVLINPLTKEAYGVEYEKKGVIYKVGASKEVILSAGTFNSPQLLMLSGIGPRQDLQQLGIPVLRDLPVGRNLQDHLSFLGLSFTTNQRVTLHFRQLLNPLNFYRFYQKGTGPLTSLGGAQAIAYIKTDQSREPEDIPDIELLFASISLASDFGIFIRTGMGIRDDVYNAVFKPLEGDNSFMILPVLLHPKSRGYLKLRSNDPHDYPMLYGNFFTDPENDDLDTLFAAIRYVQKLMRTPPFYKYNVTFNTNPIPGCRLFTYDSEPYWRCALRHLAQTLHHQVGTVKMGPSKDPEAVVDNELKVYGVKRLRVADCSIIPFALGAHTSAPAIMVGEKAADLIKTDWIKIVI